MFLTRNDFSTAPAPIERLEPLHRGAVFLIPLAPTVRGDFYLSRTPAWRGSLLTGAFIDFGEPK